MENASNALLIAGAVLLAMLVIGVAMSLYTSLSATVTDGTVQIDIAIIDMHNKKIFPYMGTVKGTDVKTCIWTFLHYNDDPVDADLKVSVIVDNLTYVDRSLLGSGIVTANTDNMSNNIKAYYQYTSFLKYNKSGAITEIVFTKID